VRPDKNQPYNFVFALSQTTPKKTAGEGVKWGNKMQLYIKGIGDGVWGGEGGDDSGIGIFMRMDVVIIVNNLVFFSSYKENAMQ